MLGLRSGLRSRLALRAIVWQKAITGTCLQLSPRYLKHVNRYSIPCLPRTSKRASGMSTPRNLRARRRLNARYSQIKAAAAIGGHTLDEPAGYIHYTTNRTLEFTAKFASGKVPAFEDKVGFCLFEGNAIARYSKRTHQYRLDF